MLPWLAPQYSLHVPFHALVDIDESGVNQR
jgi:hypothetical protein